MKPSSTLHTLEERKPTHPLIIALVMAYVGLLIGFMGKVMSYPSSEIIFIATIAVILICMIAYPLKAFQPNKEKKDLWINFFHVLLLVAALSRFYSFFDPFYNFVLRGIGKLLELWAIIFFVRYFQVRSGKTNVEITQYPFLAILPLWIVGFVFKMQSWPYASEMLTISVLIHWIASIAVIIYLVIKKKIDLLSHFVYLIGVNILFTGILFKIQSWPYATLLLQAGFVIVLLRWILLLFSKNEAHEVDLLDD